MGVIVVVIVVVTGGKQSQLLALALGLGWSLTIPFKDSADIGCAQLRSL